MSKSVIDEIKYILSMPYTDADQVRDELRQAAKNHSILANLIEAKVIGKNLSKSDRADASKDHRRHGTNCNRLALRIAKLQRQAKSGITTRVVTVVGK